MIAPNKLFFATRHGWKSNGLYVNLGSARNALSGALGWEARSTTGTRNPHKILVADNVKWTVLDEIPDGTKVGNFPWQNKSKVRAARLRERAQALLAEAEALDPQVQPFVPAGEMTHDIFKKLVGPR